MREEEKVEHERKLVRVEAEMSEVFNRKVGRPFSIFIHLTTDERGFNRKVGSYFPFLIHLTTDEQGHLPL